MTLRERLGNWWRTRELRHRALGALSLLVVICGAVVAFFGGIGATIDFFRSLPTSLDLHRITTPAAEGEYLIILTEFKDESDARHLDVPTVLAEGIQAALPANLNARIAIAEDVTLTDSEKALALAQRYNATIIIWGRYNDHFVEPNFTSPVDLPFATEPLERRKIRQSVEELRLIVDDLAAGPVRWLSLFTIGQILVRHGQYDAAVDCFTSAIDLLNAAPGQGDQLAANYLMRGITFYAQDLSAEAIDDFTIAIALLPEGIHRALAYYLRADRQLAMGDPVGAAEDYTEALSLFPSSEDKAMAYHARSVVRAGQGDLAGATSDLTEAIRLYPEGEDRANAFLGRAIVRAEAGDRTAAVEDYTEAASQLPDGADKAMAHLGRALVRHEEGDFSGAIEDYSEAIRLYGLAGSEDEVAYAIAMRGHCRADQHDLDAAISDLSEAIRLLPDGTEKAQTYSIRGLARAELGDRDGAIADLEQAVAILPASAHVDNAQAYRNLAQGHARFGETEQACKYLTLAVVLDPEILTTLSTDASFGSIRDEPCYQVLFLPTAEPAPALEP